MRRLLLAAAMLVLLVIPVLAEAATSDHGYIVKATRDALVYKSAVTGQEVILKTAGKKIQYGNRLVTVLPANVSGVVYSSEYGLYIQPVDVPAVALAKKPVAK